MSSAGEGSSSHSMEEPLPTETQNPNSIPKFPRRRRRHLDSATYRAFVHLYSFRFDEAPNSDPNPSSEAGNGTEIEKASSSGNPMAERKRNEEEDRCPNPRSEIGKYPVSDRNCIEIEKDSSSGNPTVEELAERKRNEEEDQCPNPRSEIGKYPASDRNCIEFEKDSSSGNPTVDELAERKRNEEEDRCPNPRLEIGKVPVSDRNCIEIEKDSSSGNPTVEELAERKQNEEEDQCPNPRSEIGKYPASDRNCIEFEKDSSSGNPTVDELAERKRNEEEDRCPNPRLEIGKDPVSDQNCIEIAKVSSSGNPLVDELVERKRNEEEDQCPNPRLEIGKDPVSDGNCIDIEKDSSCGNPRLGSADGLGEKVPDDEKGPAFANPDSALESLQNEVLDTEEFEIDDCDVEWLNNIMSDCAELIGGDDGPRVGEGTDGEPAKAVEFEKPVAVQEVTEGLIDGELEEGASPVVDFEKPATAQQITEGRIDDKEIEEGEISGDSDTSAEPRTVQEDQKLKEPLCNNHTRTDSNIDSMGKPIVIKPTIRGDKFTSCTDVTQSSRKRETVGSCTFKSSQGNSEKLSIANKENTSESSDTKATEQVKRKRGALTAERKAKKKIAKKRKKAQKDREQGVKRLKLLPAMKPTKLKDCVFYLKGKCQQGSSCKFSHDTTPLTKSQPCTHFARDSCLKGDECPYSHQLSQFPCHLLMASGTCFRGDRCKFSHELTPQDGSSPLSVTGKLDPLPSMGRSNLGKQLNLGTMSLSASGSSKCTASSVQSMTPKSIAGNVLATQAPKGIRFLSFRKSPINDFNNKKDNLVMGNRGAISNQQGQGKLGEQPKNASSFTRKSDSVKSASQCDANTVSNQAVCSPANNGTTRPDLLNNKFGSKQDRLPSKSLQTEASEASRILEEFLFCGNS